MDYSKTHYYKYTAPANAKQTRSTVPVFEVDDIPAAPGEGPAGSATPDLGANIPDDGPNVNIPAAPSTPILPTPSLPPSGTITTPTYPNTGSQTNDIFWSYTWIAPIFNNMASVAQARFYNVNAMMEPVDIYLNNQLVVSDLDYAEYTDFLYIIPGYYTVTVYRRTNPNYPFLNVRVNFARNSTCTVSLIGNLDTAGLQFIC